MRTFIAKHQKSGLKMTFKYGLNQVLKSIELDGEWTGEQVRKIIATMPTTTEKMLLEIKLQRLDTPWIFAELTEVSFEAFYKMYPKKVGRKADTEKAWNKLPEADKMEAILYISELVKLKNDGTAFPYPATYLNKKYWK